MTLDKEYFNILIFGHKASKTRHLKIRKKTVKISFYLIGFALLSTTFFFCDYIQVKKKTFLLNQLHQESQIRKSQIQLFSTKIEELENRLIRLEDFDRRIRTIANMEKTQEVTPFIGMGGSPTSLIQGKIKETSGSE